MAWDVFAKYLFPLKEPPQAIYFVPSVRYDLALGREKENLICIPSTTSITLWSSPTL